MAQSLDSVSLKVNEVECQRGYNQLFTDLSFEAKSGDIFRITGTNGSGKTSLLKILAGINSAEAGTVTIDNHPVGCENYQQSVLYLGHLSAISSELTATENLHFLTQLNASKNKYSLTQALVQIGLAGYEDEYCAKLSAGQKRRVILAALFLSNAKVWLLDEPFTALDPLGVEIVEGCIQQHCENGGICLFTTHQDSSLKNQKILSL